jgi:hypothetical protein
MAQMQLVIVSCLQVVVVGLGLMPTSPHCALVDQVVL